jgi:hypothetical protein
MKYQGSRNKKEELIKACEENGGISRNGVNKTSKSFKKVGRQASMTNGGLGPTGTESRD